MTYSTGELAKAAGVTVRTVQFYDTKGILIPYDYSEGGRRMYREEELDKLKVICFLKDLGLSLQDISKIITAQNSEKIIGTLLKEQERVLSEEIRERDEKREKVRELQKLLNDKEEVTVESIKDMAKIMSGEKMMKKVYRTMLLFGLPAEAVEIATLMLGILKGIWIPFGVCMLVIAAATPFLVVYYYRNVLYICPECHNEFKPKKAEFFFAAHTPKTRRLKCPCCGKKNYCVETFAYAVESVEAN